MKFKGICKIVAAVALATGVAAAGAQEWPGKPVVLVVPFGAGGNFDFVARVVGKQLSKELKQPVIVENKPGAGGMLGANYVAHAKGDGYTFLVGGNGTITNTLIRTDQPYKDEELAPVAMMTVAPSVTVTNPSSKFNDLREIVADAKQSGRQKIPFATAGVGSTPHFVAALFQIASGLTIQPIQYKSGLATILAVAGGEVPLASEAMPVVLPLVKSGKVKAVAVTLPHRSKLLPDVPTTTELGLEQMQMGHFVGLWAPANTPADILEKMNAAVNTVLSQQDVQQQFASSGTEVLAQSRPAFMDFIKTERARLKSVVSGADMASNQ
jgi:tripartite-type tricarboxylate transporter receptor subunit TctC